MAWQSAHSVGCTRGHFAESLDSTCIVGGPNFAASRSRLASAIAASGAARTCSSAAAMIVTRTIQ